MTRHGGTRLFLVVCMLTTLLGISQSAATAAPSWHASNFTTLGLGGDIWWNYDSSTQQYDPNVDPTNASAHTDWPLTQFFWHNGTTVRTQLALCSSGTFDDYCSGGGSNHNLRALDTGSWFWSTNPEGGRKNGNPCNGWDIHYVGYPGQNAYGQAFYNTSWGFWVPISTHYDYNDGSGCTGNTQFGYSDQAEANLENAERNAPITMIPQAAQNWYNYEGYRVESYNWGNHIEYHIWENNRGTVPVYVN